MSLKYRFFELFSPFGGGVDCWREVSRKGKVTLSSLSTRENVIAKIEQSPDKRIAVRFQNVAPQQGVAQTLSKTYVGFRSLEAAKLFVYRKSLFGNVLSEKGLE